MRKSNEHLWGIVLAAGQGTRVRRFLTQLCGGRGLKQFCTITGTRSMLQQTLARVERIIPRERILVIVSDGDRLDAAQQLSAWPAENIIYQPVDRGTAPGILLPLVHVSRRDPAAIVAVFPCDHFILDESTFMASVATAISQIEQSAEELILLGMKPDRPEEEFGWIETFDNEKNQVSSKVWRFWEKPSAFKARELFSRGALWNTFVFAAEANALWDMVLNRAPDLYHSFRSIWLAMNGNHGQAYTDHIYNQIRTVDFSTEILQHLAHRLRVLPVPEVGWSDWGSAERICESLKTIGKLEECFTRLKQRNADFETLKLVAGYLDKPPASRRHSVMPALRSSQEMRTINPQN
jgi:mannose-1-phosphate guanylyltransferase